MTPKRIAVLTSGGDAPGMNAALHTVAKCGAEAGIEVIGVKMGYGGLLGGDENLVPLHESDTLDYMGRGGTFLKTWRCPEFYEPSARRTAYETLTRNHIDALVVIGGDGSFTGARKLSEENGDYPVVCVPATIDNDLRFTDYSIGFDTAVTTVMNLMSQVRDTMMSHSRTGIICCMGRHCGDITEYAGRAGGADIVLLPPHRKDEIRDDEWEHHLDYLVGEWDKLRARGVKPSIILVAEGCLTQDEKAYFRKVKPVENEDNPEFELHASKLGKHRKLMTLEELRFQLTYRLKKKYPDEYISMRTANPAHMQRGGSPTAQDRFLAERLSAYAMKCLAEGKHGIVVGIVDDQEMEMPIQTALAMQYGETTTAESASR